MKPVTNWLQITNLDSTVQTFTKELYNLAGALLDSETVSIPPQGRFDLAAGHQLGAGLAGLVKIIPADPSANYLAQVFRYGTNAVAGQVPSSFSFAKALNAQSASNQCEWHTISAGGDAFNFLVCLLYTSPSPRDKRQSRMPSSA